MMSELNYANRLYVFCPSVGQGLEFIVQELPDAVAKFAGSLPEGQFLSSGVKPINWDEKVNGDIDTKDELGTRHSQQVLMRDGSYRADTVVVDSDTFLSLLHQIKMPKKHDYNGYLVFNLKLKQNKLTKNEDFKNKEKKESNKR